MDAGWKRWLIMAVLWGSPVLITVGVIAVGAYLQTVRRNFGAMNSKMGITVVMGVVGMAIHAGYFMAPLMHDKGGGGELWALVLMGVAALVVVGGGLLFLLNTGVGEDLARQLHGPLGTGLVGLLVLAVYGGPIVVLLAA